MKARGAQEQTGRSEASKTSDSGYSGMDSREDPNTSNSSRSKATGNEPNAQRHNDRDGNSNDQVVRQENKGQAETKNKASNDPSYQERRRKGVEKDSKSEHKSHGGRKSQEGRKTEDDSRSESSDRQVELVYNIYYAQVYIYRVLII